MRTEDRCVFIHEWSENAWEEEVVFVYLYVMKHLTIITLIISITLLLFSCQPEAQEIVVQIDQQNDSTIIISSPSFLTEVDWIITGEWEGAGATSTSSEQCFLIRHDYQYPITNLAIENVDPFVITSLDQSQIETMDNPYYGNHDPVYLFQPQCSEPLCYSGIIWPFDLRFVDEILLNLSSRYLLCKVGDVTYYLELKSGLDHLYKESE